MDQPPRRLPPLPFCASERLPDPRPEPKPIGEPPPQERDRGLPDEDGDWDDPGWEKRPPVQQR